MSYYFCERKHKALLEYWELRDGRFLVREEDGKLCTYPADQFDYAFVRTTARPVDAFDVVQSNKPVFEGEALPQAVQTAPKRGITPNAVSPLGGVTIVDPSKL